ncbi:unnamed protein product [Schistosoma turkestanicum]|nr:unnamed protein product [Schistosoma turkestanicum]
MITWEFREVFEPNQRNDHCNGTSCIIRSQCWTDAKRLSGLILMFIALLLAVIIIFIKHFHSTSTRNTIFIIVTIPLAVLSLICWCGSMFLVILLTTYYMKKYCESEDYSSLYMTLISAFEFVILLIISEIHVNYFAHCCQNSTVTQQNRF